MLFLYVQLLMYREMFYICSDYAPLRTFAKLDLFLRSKVSPFVILAVVALLRIAREPRVDGLRNSVLYIGLNPRAVSKR